MMSTNPTASLSANAMVTFGGCGAFSVAPANAHFNRYTQLDSKGPRRPARSSTARGPASKHRMRRPVGRKRKADNVPQRVDAVGFCSRKDPPEDVSKSMTEDDVPLHTSACVCPVASDTPYPACFPPSPGGPLSRPCPPTTATQPNTPTTPRRRLLRRRTAFAG